MKIAIDIDPPVVSNEHEWEKWVVSAARLMGWRVAKLNAALNLSDPGVPDLLLARRGRVFFIELKFGTGGTTPDQERWIEELDGAVSFDASGPAVRSMCVYPETWEDLMHQLAPNSPRLWEVRSA
mgnify:CR=1 FL=1